MSFDLGLWGVAPTPCPSGSYCCRCRPIRLSASVLGSACGLVRPLPGVLRGVCCRSLFDRAPRAPATIMPRRAPQTFPADATPHRPSSLPRFKAGDITASRSVALAPDGQCMTFGRAAFLRQAPPVSRPQYGTARCVTTSAPHYAPLPSKKPRGDMSPGLSDYVFQLANGSGL